MWSKSCHESGPGVIQDGAFPWKTIVKRGMISEKEAASNMMSSGKGRRGRELTATFDVISTLSGNPFIVSEWKTEFIYIRNNSEVNGMKT